ncbi:MAG: hypothetical protein R3C15_03520 [Thermoleophilia bacterium]
MDPAAASYRITLPMELLYDAVAVGMIAYSSLAFRVRILDREHVRFTHGTLVLATHRAETDVPLLCGSFFRHWRVWRDRDPRLLFAARDDLFDKGFFAGFPPGVPRWARRLLYPIDIGERLPRITVFPATPPGAMRLGHALRRLPPRTPLAEVLPAELVDALVARASSLGVPVPRTAADADDADFADILWRVQTPETLDHEAFAEAWKQRAVEATADLRWLVDVVAAQHPLLVFPEGRPSPDGEIGPIRKGVGILVRRGRPRVIKPVGVAYDGLTRGRASALIGILPDEPPPTGGDVDAAMLDLLRRAMPLSLGQVAASAVLDASEAGAGSFAPAELAERLGDALVRAREEGRPVDPDLERSGPRVARLDDCLRALIDRGALRRSGGRALALVPEVALADPLLARLRREHASAYVSS